MSDCRKDNRGRKLRKGESRHRKDRRYMYKYLDALEQTHYAGSILGLLASTEIHKLMQNGSVSRDF